MKLKKKRIREVRVGAMIIVVLIIIVAVVFSIGGQNKLFGEKVKYRILFNSTGGLFEGDPVMLTGVEVGNVTRLWFPEDVMQKKIMVEISILKEVSPRIREDTRARIAAASLVYGKVVELTMGSAEMPAIPIGGVIKVEERVEYGAIFDSTNLLIDDIRRVLGKMDRGEGAVGMMLNEPLEIRQTLHHLSVSSKKLSDLLEGLDRGQGPLGALLSDTLEFHQTLEDFKKTSADLGRITENLKSRNSVFGKLVNDEEYGQDVMEDLRSTIRSLSNVAAKLDTGHGSLGSLINDKELFYGLQDVVLGIQKSKMTKWIIQDRRKAGEKERARREALENEKGGK